jgi:hypothetical protein
LASLTFIGTHGVWAIKLSTSAELATLNIKNFFSHLQEQLLELMKDFKDEGNCLFQENSFKLSCTLYTHSLTVAQMLDTHHFQRVDVMTLATLYANRSACHLKLVG